MSLINDCGRLKWNIKLVFKVSTTKEPYYIRSGTLAVFNVNLVQLSKKLCFVRVYVIFYHLNYC